MSEKNSSGGISFMGMLTILFIGLKLAGSISWPWWLVLSPIWGGFLMFVAVLAIVLIARGE